MKDVTIKIKAAMPDDIIKALDEIKQAIALGSDGYKSRSRQYEFETEGEYEK